MKLSGLFFLLLFISDIALGIQCSNLLYINLSKNPYNVGFYMGRPSLKESFFALNLPVEMKVRTIEEGLLYVKGLPYLVLKESPDPERAVLELPLGLRISALIESPTFGRVLGQLVLKDIKLLAQEPFTKDFSNTQLRRGVTITSTLIAEQALSQLVGSLTYQKSRSSDQLFIKEQEKAFELLTDKLASSANITSEDLVAANLIVTGHSNLRRGDLSSKEIGVIRGGVSKQAVELYQPDAGIHYLPSKHVQEALSKLIGEVNRLGYQSNLLDIAKIYQNFILIHPFSDGNGRVSRALLDYILLRSGFPPLNHSKETSHIMYYSPEVLSNILARNLS